MSFPLVIVVIDPEWTSGLQWFQAEIGPAARSGSKHRCASAFRSSWCRRYLGGSAFGARRSVGGWPANRDDLYHKSLKNL